MMMKNYWAAYRTRLNACSIETRKRPYQSRLTLPPPPVKVSAAAHEGDRYSPLKGGAAQDPKDTPIHLMQAGTKLDYVTTKSPRLT